MSDAGSDDFKGFDAPRHASNPSRANRKACAVDQGRPDRVRAVQARAVRDEMALTVFRTTYSVVLKDNMEL
jgi:hypothetical protein